MKHSGPSHAHEIQNCTYPDKLEATGMPAETVSFETRMTCEEAVVQYLYSNGLLGDQARYIAANTFARLGGDWARRKNDDASGYPKAMVAVLAMHADRSAVQWIDEHCPKHWARAFFARNERR